MCGLAGFVALAIVAATCSDLTAPKGFNGTVAIAFKWPPPGTVPPDSTVQALVGEKLSPPFSITLNGTELARARYLFSLDSLGDTTVIRVNQTGDNVEIMGRGKRRLWATVVGATVGVDTIHRTYIYINATPADNKIDSTSLTFGSLTETKELKGRSLAADGVTTIPPTATSLAWSSADASVVTVTKKNDSTAVVTAVGNGTTTITALFDSIIPKTIPVTVTQRLNKYRMSTAQGPTSVRLNSIGQQIGVTAVAVDSMSQPIAGASAPQFNTTDAGNVRIDANTGVITADGNTASPPPSVFVTLNGQQRSDNLPVVVKQVARSVAIQNAKVDTIRSEGGVKANVNALVPDTLGTQMRDPNAIQWISSDPAIATVDNKTPATITAVKSGTTLVIAKADAQADTITIVVTNDPDKIELIPTSVAIRSLEDTVTLSITVRNANNNKLNVIPVLTSDNPTVVQVRNDSLLIGKTQGTATVTATTPNGKTASAPVIVTNAPQTLIIVPTTLTLASIGDLDSTFAIDFRNGRNVVLPRASANWSSQDITVARVGTDINKPIIAVGPGDTYVVAVSPVDPQKRDSILVTVTNASNSVVISPPAPANLTAIGATTTLTAVVRNAAGNPVPSASVTWSVLPAGATFVSINATTGVATALGNGTATIQATSGSATQTVNLTVAQAYFPSQSTITPGAASITADGAATTLITAQLRDANGNSLTFGGSAVVLASSLGTLLADFTDNGNGNYTQTLRSGTVANTANISTVGAVTITPGTSVSFTAGAAAIYNVTSTSLAPVAGSSVTILAQLADQFGNAKATPTPVAVTFTNTGGGSFTTANPANTNASGVAQVTFSTNAVATNHTIIATSAGPITGQSPVIASTAGTAANYTVTPATTGPPAAGLVTISAQLRDASGNAVALSGQTVNWDLTNANGNFSGSATAVSSTDNSGIATVVLTTSTTAGASTQVRANFGSSPAGTSAVITTVAGAAQNVIANSVSPQNSNVGTAVAAPPSVLVRDQFNNPVAGVQVTFAVASGGGSGTGLIQLTNASGVATVGSWTLGNTIGPNSLTATVPGLATSPITFNATGLGTAALSVTQQGSEAGPVNIVYTVTLNAANTTGAPVTFDVANSGGTATSGLDFTAFGGAAAISVANGATTGTLTVTVLTDALVEGTETVQATISNSSSAAVSIAGASATANITDGGATAVLSVTTQGNEAGPVNIVYTVTLSKTNTTGAPITFDVANSGGTATSGSDFTAFGGVAAISVANGASTGALTVTVTNDALLESTETVQATISNPSNATVTITGASATANITDNDAATAALSVTTQGSETGPTSIVYTVTLSATNNTGTPISFDVANSGGTATSGADFTAFGGAAAISVANGATTGTLTVAVINDAILEPTETVQATISNPSNAAVAITTASATANITDNEAATASLSVTTHGNEAGPTNIVYTVTLSTANNTGAAITFDVANSGGTATSGSDFTAFAGAAAISVANGATTGTLTVAVLDDALVEGTETVQATISNPSNAAVAIAGASATANLIDNDGATAALSVTTHGNEAGPVNIVYTVTLSSANTTGVPITFDIANSGGTATSGSDFTAFGGVGAISVANGASTGTFTVTVLNDLLLEGTETVQATISNPSNSAVLITGASATANIIDNETATAALSVTTHGNEAGPVSIVYTVTLNTTNNSGAPITFDVANSGGTATSGSDFTAFGGTAAINVANGATTGTLTVPVINDVLLEGTETVQATISNPSSTAVTVTTPSATANIADNDAATASLSVTQHGLEAGPVNIVYTVTLSSTNNSGAPITFDVTNSGGTATSGSDFTAFGGVAAISVANGATTGTLTVTVINDALLEATETVDATISNSSNASVTIGTATATANITDNDGVTAALSVTTHGSEAGPVNIVYTVTLSGTNNTGAPITFDVANSGGTATSGADFTAFGGAAAISVLAGASTGTLTVTVANDVLLESTETVQATISNPSNAAVSITGASATANITDNDTANAALSVTTHGNEAGPVNIVYTVTLSTTNNTGAPITFDVANSGGTATSGSDFVAFGGVAAMSVANGATTGTLTVTVLNDALLEATETVDATISNPSLGAAITVTTPTATANITEQGATAVLSVTQHGAEATPTNIIYTVTLSKTNTTSAPITFDVANSGGTATSGSDFTAFGGVAAINVANGASTGTLTVTVTNDVLLENTETVQATISNPSSASVSITGASATANIIDNETATAVLSVTTHGDEAGPVNIVYTVTLNTTNNSGAPITFDVANSGGTATSGSDFTAFGGAAAISVANGATTGTLTVTVLNDALLEATETVQATISNPSLASVTVTGASATANITDNETATAVLSVAQHGTEAGPVNIVYRVTLSTTNNSGAPITFDVANSGGTATSGSDFTAFGGVAAISVANGATTGTLTVTVINDALLENTETVDATISNPSLASVSVTGATATANITDNETATAALSVTQHGNEAGPVNIIYTVTLSSINNSGAPITFDVANSGGSATSGSDFTAFGGVAAISVANGATTGTLSVTVTNDVLLEGTETVQATISNPSSAAVSITGASATANITDNETATAALSVTQHGTEAGPVNIIYTVTLSSTNSSGAPITFDVTNSGGTASSGSDFTAFGGAAAISVANGATTGTLTVTVINDGLLEGTETVAATISNPSLGAAITFTTPSATANITDNETATAALSVTGNGHEAGLNIVFTVTLSTPNNTGAPITFDVANSGGTATSGSDFVAFAGAAAISVANGASTGTLTVQVLDDALLESVETVQATISNPSLGAAITFTTPTATANITSDEFASADLSVTTHGNEAGPVNIVYTVTLGLANNTGAPVTFDVSNSGGTATSGSDFTAFGGVAAISVANGATTGTLTVTVINDALLEGTETVEATISNPSSSFVFVQTSSATANIADNETATAALSVTTHGNEAGPVNIVYTVTLNMMNNSGAPITFDVSNSGGTAASGSDFVAFGGPAAISVPDGATTGSLTVTVLNDALLENTETVEATISNPSLGTAITFTTPTATANITEQGATAVLSVSQHGAEAASSTNIIYTVTLNKTNVTGSAITFDIDDLLTGTAASGSDYTAIAGAATISVANGASSGNFTVTVLNDALLEGTETVVASISNPSNGSVTVTGASATANIVDNETATAALSVTTQGNEAGPVNIVYTVTLNRTNNTGAPITFAASNSGGTAISGSDFTAFDGPAAISVANGASTGTLTVTVIDDALLENTETVEASISDPSLGSAITFTTPTATANITESGATANLSVFQNGAEPATNIIYRVSLMYSGSPKTNVTGANVTVSIADAGTGTAASGSDYTAFGGTVAVASGSSTGDFTVTVSNDALLENTETVNATISGPSPASVMLGTASASANITSDDLATADLTVLTNGAEPATNIVYRVTLSKVNNTGASITVPIADLGTGTAASGADYVAFGGNVTILNGNQTGDFTVTVSNDALLENTETVIAQISNPTSHAQVTVGTTDASADITSEDLATANLSVLTDGNEAGEISIVYRVTLTKVNNTGASITVPIADLLTGTASSGSDYTAFGGNVTILNGNQTGDFSVAVIDDALLEVTETVIAQISDPTSHPQVTVGTTDATADIAESGGTVNLVVQTNGSETGPTPIVYRVELMYNGSAKTNETGTDITVNYADVTPVAVGKATPVLDYGAFGGSVTIGAGATSATFAVTVVDDLLVEGTETVDAQISGYTGPASAAIGTATATANIIDND